MRLEEMRGRRYGRYEILALLGRGGMAAVYRARDTMLQRDVALKLLYPQYSGDTTLVERFEREAVLAAGLDHPGIVPIYDVGESQGVVYIAMKLLEGRSLADLLAATPVMQLDELVPIVEQIASALDYAHARGIVHRDIKPANIILEQRSRPGAPPATVAVLTDFGIAKSLDSPSMTGTGVLIGTPDYMAPEQIRGDRSVDGRADIYALGALVFRALTGRRPFEGSTQEVLLGHLEGRLPAPSSINPALPPGVDASLRRAMALRPDDRYDSAGAFGRALRAAAGLESPTPPPAARLPGDPRAVVPRAAASDLARRATADEQTVRASAAPTVAPTARGPVPAMHARQPAGAGQPHTARRPQPEPARPRSRLPAVLLVAVGLLALLGVGLLLGRLSAGAIGVVPTPQPPTPGLTASPVPTAAPGPILGDTTPTATGAPTSTPAPSSTAAPTTVPPTATTTPSPTVAPSARPTQAPPTSRPPTAVPASAVPATAVPSATASPTATVAPSPTSPPSATPPPTSTSTPTATPCAIATQGGFAMLREQNEIVRTRLGCPAQPIQGGAGTLAEQPFQHGSMLYFEPREAIWVFIGVERGIWYRFDQATLASTPTPTPAEPPQAGLYVPVRGFGLVWAYNEEIRTQLGYGTAPEAGLFEGAYQQFTGGTMLYSATGLGRGKTLYVLYADGTFERYDDPNQ
jgi:serine/threonine-protein kinase